MLKVKKWTRLLKFAAVGGAGLGLVTSLHANNYDVSSIGIVRFATAAKTVSITLLEH
jgi:aarF domain-containing kinase